MCGRCFGRQNHLKRHVEGVHKNVLFTNLVSTDSDGTTILKFEPQETYSTKRKKSTGLLQTKSADELGTTIMVPPTTSSVSSVSGTTYKSISIIASNTETAALGLVSIGNCNFETSTTSLEPQSIIVENIDLEALNPAFVTSGGNQILN